MPTRHAHTSILLPLAALLIACPVLALETAPDVAPAKRTVQTLREVGVAMFSWLSEQPPAATTPQPAEPATIDWASCPSVSAAEAATRLVPEHLAELPRFDGWGHPLEFCLRTDVAAPGAFSIGVRSPGRDGKFEGTVYTVGELGKNAFDRDLVWIDGYFVTWPGSGV